MALQRLTKRRFVFFFHWLGFNYLSFGLHVFPPGPNMEVHLPFGFVKLGFQFASYDPQIRTIGYFDGKWQTQCYGEEE